jgi:hypothetical protein
MLPQQKVVHFTGLAVFLKTNYFQTTIANYTYTNSGFKSNSKKKKKSTTLHIETMTEMPAAKHCGNRKKKYSTYVHRYIRFRLLRDFGVTGAR